MLIAGAWYLVQVGRFPSPGAFGGRTSFWDAVSGHLLSREQALRLYSEPVYTIHLRRLSKREMRQLPIPIDLQ